MAKYHLKLCPFCGSKTAPRLKFHGFGIKRFFIVKCERNLGGCGANTTGGTRRFAIENWNVSYPTLKGVWLEAKRDP